MAQAGASASKKVVLANFSQKLDFHALISSVTFCYNGHGTVKEEKSLKSEAGAWICEHGEFMYPDEVVEVVVARALKQNSKITLKIVADNCGSSGGLHRLLEHSITQAEHVEERSGEVLRQVGEEGGELGGGGELRGHVPGQHPPHGLQG